MNIRLTVLFEHIIMNLLLCLAFSGVILANSLSPQEKRGKHIYLEGIGFTDTEITAYMGNNPTEIPGAAMPCVNCHGLDGKGKPEGGVIPSNVTWEALTKSYEITSDSGRKHQPYTEQTIIQAITKGIDPSNNRLLAAMPRYQIVDEDIADLIAYLKTISKDQDPGITETKIKVGTILPGNGANETVGTAIKDVLIAYFDELNSQGGIYNRKIDLVFTKSLNTDASSNEHVKEFLEKEQVFAMVGAFFEGNDKEFCSMIENEEIPFVASSTLFPQVQFPLNPYIFYLFSGLENQSSAFVNFAEQRLSILDPRIAIVYTNDEQLDIVSSTFGDLNKKNEWNSLLKFQYSGNLSEADKLIDKLRKNGINIIFSLGYSKLGDLLKKFTDEQFAPVIFIPGTLVEKDIFDVPSDFMNKIYLSFSFLPSDQNLSEVKEFLTLANKHKIPRQHLAAQISTYCAAKIFVEGLKRAGREVSRKKLISMLEGLYEYETGLTMPITYGPNRRIGIDGVHIATIDIEKKKFKPVGVWIGN